MLVNIHSTYLNHVYRSVMPVGIVFSICPYVVGCQFSCVLL